MNIRKLLIFLPLIALMGSCSLTINFSGGSSSPSEDPSEPGGEIEDPEEGGELTKQTLTYTYNDYNSHYVYNTSAMPSSGEAKYLVIPVWLSDSSSYYNASEQDNYIERIDKAFFGTDSEVGWKSVKTYYEELSNNTVTISGEVSPIYVTTYSTSNITQNATVNIAKSAVDYWKSLNDSTTIRSYDSDSDGYIDAVSLVYFAPNYKSSIYSGLSQASNNNLWAFVFWVQQTSLKSFTSPGVNAYMWAAYDFLDAKNACPIDTHTVIHETGHLFGLVDYYDYSSECYLYAGGFSMQDYNVGCHDPWSVMALGWAQPYVPTETCEITIGSFQNTKDLILLTPQFHNSAFDEFLLLEFYSPTGLNQLDATTQYDSGRPKGPSSYGIRLWHVDARLCYNNSTLSTSITSGRRYCLANTNTYWTGESDLEERVSVMNIMRNYRLLNLIRRNDFTGSKNKSYLSSTDLFGSYSSFDVSDYSSYFQNSTTLNNGQSLGFTFTVKSINALTDKAVIQITKL